MGTFPFLQCDHNLQDDHFVTGGGGGGFYIENRTTERLGMRGGKASRMGDDDELMLHVLRCHLTY